DQGRHPEQGPDLHDSDERAGHSVAKPDRPGIVAHGSQTRSELAHRTTAGQGLDRGREDDEDQVQEHRHRDAGDGVVGALGHQQGDEQADRHGDARNQHVQEAGDCAQGDAGGGQVQSDGLAGDEVVDTHAQCAAAHAALLVMTRSAYPASTGGRGGRQYSVGVDLDAFVAAHQGEWSRLEYLARHGSGSGAEADEILDLYQRVATHLSVVRSSAPDPSLVTYLSSLLARTRTRSAGTRSVAWSDLWVFFAETFPAALYRTRRWWVLTALANLGASLVVGWWFLSHPQFESSLMSPSEIDKLVNTDFEHYYREFAALH